MLLRLGEQLPGAIRVIEDSLERGIWEEQEQRSRIPRDPYRFALPGVLPKLTANEEGDRLTIPVEGTSGAWIAKFGTPAFRHLVENECVMLRWASLCGLDVPNHRIIQGRDIEGLPEHFDPEQRALLVRRFDRRVDQEGMTRIHQEDFAQIFHVAPEDKYTESHDQRWMSHETIGHLILELCGSKDFEEYLRRLVFMVLSGNSDAHLKNWALWYPDRLRARLAPVYDFVATIVYGGEGGPALCWREPETPSLAPEKPLVETTLDDLLLLCPSADTCTAFDTAQALGIIEEFETKAREQWKEVQGELPAWQKNKLAAHLDQVRLG
ncbi:MAG: HipA domain-containing protein [Polyangiaceae bacterium]|jgi:serine/threonine-protein kinase HipA|nr:HipA domain-containing protein [Polyangiaceae bacterium]